MKELMMISSKVLEALIQQIEELIVEHLIEMKKPLKKAVFYLMVFFILL